MIQMKPMEKIVLDGIKAHLKNYEFRPCQVIRQNQNSPAPSYPYVSYTVLTPNAADQKGWSTVEGGRHFKPVRQIWSITVQSDRCQESQEIAAALSEWFSFSGNLYLSDHGIVPEKVTSITSRDTLLTVDYEYRNGFDVTFGMINWAKEIQPEKIENAVLKHKEGKYFG